MPARSNPKPVPRLGVPAPFRPRHRRGGAVAGKLRRPIATRGHAACLVAARR
jgi:hypothetical protein